MVHWWSRALQGDREIDTTKIEVVGECVPFRGYVRMLWVVDD